MDRSAMHFVDSDITGTSGLDEWTSDNFAFPAADPAKISISTMAELAKIGIDDAYPLNGDYELIANLDADVAPYNTGAGWTPIGDWIVPLANNAFSGTFDGKHHTISNLYIHEPTTNATGLFGSLYNATIENLNLIDINYTTGNSPGQVFGGLVGYTSGNNSLGENIYVTGQITINKTDSIGLVIAGMVGWCGSAGQSEWLKCGCKVDIICSGNGRSNIFWIVGGFCAKPGHDKFVDCYCQGRIYHDTDPTKSIFASGMFGDVGWGTAPDNEYTRCYSAMNIDMDASFTGGWVYWETDPVESTYTDNHWDKTIAPTLDDKYRDAPLDIIGVDSETTIAMYQQATYENWDFDTVWKIDEGNDYPTHQWQDQNPFQIKTGEQNRTTTMPTDRSHLNGETVQILEDGTVSPTQTVTNGTVTLTGTVNHVGLQYISKLKPMKI